MKKLCIISVVLILSINLYGQKTQSEKVADIRTWYKEVTSNIDNYSKTVVDYSEESTEGGEITFFKKAGDVVLFKVAYYGETGNMKFSFYFRNSELFFVFQETENYSVPIYVETDNRTITKEENRYYFYCNKMVKWLDNSKKSVLANVSVFKEKEEELLKDVDKLLKKSEE